MRTYLVHMCESPAQDIGLMHAHMTEYSINPCVACSYVLWGDLYNLFMPATPWVAAMTVCLPCLNSVDLIESRHEHTHEVL